VNTATKPFSFAIDVAIVLGDFFGDDRYHYDDPYGQSS
jgi:hypothetical protein